MNTLFLVITAILAFVFGYRFFAKLLALGIFRLDPNYSTPAQTRTDNQDYVPANRHFLFGYHVAAVASATTLAGSATALIWGWIPAFLWLVVGTAAAAGTYGLGSLWLAVRHPGMGLGELAGTLLSPYARRILLGLAFVVLLILNAILAVLVAQLFARYPAAVLPFWLLVSVAMGLGLFLHGRNAMTLVPASAVVLIFSLLAIWLLSYVPLSFSGALNLDVRGTAVLSLDSVMTWLVLILVYGYFAAHLPVWRLVRPHGYLSALLLGLLLIILYAGVILAHPVVTAPEFNTVNGPAVLPWLFITLTSGAFAGYHLLIAHGITAKQLRHETDARYIGYGGAIADGVIGLSALLIAGTAFGAGEPWQEYYGSWEGLQNLSSLLILYINGCTRYAAELGLGEDFSRTFASVTIISLTVTTLEAGLRIQKQLLTEFRPHPTAVSTTADTDTSAQPSPAPWLTRLYAHLKQDKNLAWLAVGVTAILALSDGKGSGGFLLWPIFGGASLILGVFGLLLVVVALKRAQRSVIAVSIPMVLLWLVAVWALLAQMTHWWQTAHWLPLILALGLLGITIMVPVEAVRVYRKPLSSPPELDS